MEKKAKWLVFGFDCYHGCNNAQYNSGCDESEIVVKVSIDMHEEFDLFEKYNNMPCPRCGKVGEHKRNWYAITPEGEDNNVKLEYVGFTRGKTVSEIQDYTKEMLAAKAVNIMDEITYLDRQKEQKQNELRNVRDHLEKI